MSDGGKGDDRRPGAPGAYERGFEAIDWGARDRAELKELVEQGMAERGVHGEAAVSRGSDGAFNVTFDVPASGRLAVSFGGVVTKHRGLRDLARAGVERMVDGSQV